VPASIGDAVISPPIVTNSSTQAAASPGSMPGGRAMPNRRHMRNTP
jgi:hypothetical protein